MTVGEVVWAALLLSIAAGAWLAGGEDGAPFFAAAAFAPTLMRWVLAP